MLGGKKFIFILWLFPMIIYAQKVDSLEAYNANKSALDLNRAGKFIEAYNVIQTYIVKQENIHGYLPDLMVSYKNRGKVEISLGKYDESIKSAQYALEYFIKFNNKFEIADCYNLIGISYYFLSNLDSSKVYYEKSFELKKKLKIDTNQMAISSYNLALLYEDMGYVEKALKYYLKSEEYLLLESENLSFLSDVYTGIAHIYKNKNDYYKAEIFTEKAMDVGLRSYGAYNPNMTFVYTSYAHIFEWKKEYKKSIELLKKSLRIRKNTYGEYHAWTCESYYDLADVYVLDKQYSKAEKLYKKAIKVGENIEALQYLAYAKSLLAELYINQKYNYAEAEKLLQSALDYNRSVYGERNELVARNYLLLAKIAKTLDKKDKFFSLINSVYNSADYDKDSIGKVNAPFEVIDAIALIGDWYMKEYEEVEDKDQLNEFYKLIDEQLDLIEFSQKNLTSDHSRINIANKFREVFEKDLNICWALYQETKDFNYLEKAFELSETNRNKVLLSGLQDIKYKMSSKIPKEIIDQEHQIKRDLERVKLDLFNEKTKMNPDKDMISKLIHERISISNSLDSLYRELDANFPNYVDFKHGNKPIELLDVQNNLDDNLQLITYFLGKKNLYSFNISKYEIRFFKNESGADLIENSMDLKRSLIKQSNINYSSKKLYHYLLKEQIDLKKNEIVVIPDNVLNYIPFEILKNDQDEYLIEDFTVSYASSVRLFLELKNDFFNYSQANYWVGFSPDYSLKDKLSSNADEVIEIAELVNGNSYLGDNSSKSEFMNNSKNNSIIHLAMHAEINNQNPLYNKLIFSDGELTSAEIYVSDIRANLAVLSACNTGFGKIEEGEGVMSMARAFNYSGVPSIIMSLWKVSDKETKKIMVSFYKHLKKGEEKNIALKNAKMDYLSSTSDKNLKHPFYWSGFVLSGNTDMLKPPTDQTHYYVAGVIVFGIIIIGVSSRRRKKK